jgi:hypothetical protein
VAQCRGADTGLTTQCRIVAGMTSPGGLVEQCRDMTPRRVRWTACTCRCQSIKWLGRGSRCGGGVAPGASSEEDLARGGGQPSSEADFTQGGNWPSSEAEFRPRVPGPIVLVGRWAHRGRDHVMRVLSLQIYLRLCFLREKMGFPRFFRGPYGCPRQTGLLGRT